MSNKISSLMTTLFILAGVLMFAPLAQAQEGAVTWLSSPHSTDWNADDSWTTDAQPIASDGVYFGQAVSITSNTTGDVTIGSLYFNAPTTVYSTVTTTPTPDPVVTSVPSYIITNHHNFVTPSILYSFNFVNNGVVNSSLVNQYINNEGSMNFWNGSTAGYGGFEELVTALGEDVEVPAPVKITNLFYVNFDGSNFNFYDYSNAGTASIVNNAGGYLSFNDDASASYSTINNSGSMDFYGDSRAGAADITNNAESTINFYDDSSASCATIANSGFLGFWDDSTAKRSTITNEVDAWLQFSNYSTAGCADITNSGTAWFYENSDAGYSHIQNNKYASLYFGDGSSAGDACIINDGYAQFYGDASASSAFIKNNNVLNFYDGSDAGESCIKNFGILSFWDGSSASYADINNNLSMSFNDYSTADFSYIYNNNGTVDFNDETTGGHSNIYNYATLNYNDDSIASDDYYPYGGSYGDQAYVYNAGGSVNFNDFASANLVSIYNNDSNGGPAALVLDEEEVVNPGFVHFNDHTTAGSAYISNSSFVDFNDYSTAECSLIDNHVNTQWVNAVYYHADGTPYVGEDENLDGDYSVAGHDVVSSVGQVDFNDLSTAGYARICNTGDVSFNDYSTAGSSRITNNTYSLYTEDSQYFYAYGEESVGPSVAGEWSSNYDSHYDYFGGTVNFNDHSNADEARIRNNGGTVNFNDNSSAMESTIHNNYNESTDSLLTFNDNATAAWSTICNNEADVEFNDNATAGFSTIYNNEWSFLGFNDNSTAGAADINNSYYAELAFSGNASAGHSSIENYGWMDFGDNSTASESSIYNTNELHFWDNSTAGGSEIYNNDGAGLFFGNPSEFFGDTAEGEATLASAGNSNIVNSQYGYVEFGDMSTADHSTITNYGGQGFFNPGNITALDLGLPGLFFTPGSTAANSTIDNEGILAFLGSTAGSANIFNNEYSLTGFIFGGDAGNSIIQNYGILAFFDGLEELEEVEPLSDHVATAGNATITTEEGGYTVIAGTAQGGNARFIVNDGGVLDISPAFATYEYTPDAVGTTRTSVSVGSIEGYGTISLGYNNLTTGSNNLSTLFNGYITDNGYYFPIPFDETEGGSLTKIGTGTLTVLNDNDYSGGTAINGGTLAVGSSYALGTGSVAVNGGTLATAEGPVQINVGIYSDPDVIVASNYTQGAGGTLKLGLGGYEADESDFLFVSGTASLNGALDTFAYNSFQPVVGDVLPIIEAIGGRSGQFSSWTNPAGTRWLPVYGDNYVALLAIQPSFENLGGSDNEKAIGAALDGSFEDPTIYNLIANLGTKSASELQAAYDLLSPEGYSPLFNMGFSLSQDQADLINQRLMAHHGMGGSPSASASWRNYGNTPMFAGLISAEREMVIAKSLKKKAKVAEVAAPVSSNNESSNSNTWDFYTQGVGNYSVVSDTASAAGYNYTVGGMMFGLDHQFGNDLTIGVIGGFNQSISKGANASKVDATGTQLGLYTGLNKGAFYVNASGIIGRTNYKMEHMTVGGMNTGSTTGENYSTQLETGMDWKVGAVRMGPYVQGQLALVDMKAYTETGAVPMNYNNQGMDSVRTEMGWQADWTWGMGKDGGLSPSLGLAWEHQFETSLANVSGGFGAADSGFVVSGPTTGQDAALLSAGLDLAFSKSFSLYSTYSAKVGMTNLTSQSLTAGLNLGF